MDKLESPSDTLGRFSSRNPPCVVITGAGRGFGRALTSAFHAEGWQVIPVVRDPVDVRTISVALTERCNPVLADVTNNVVSERIAEAITLAGGHLSILVNNAGIAGHDAKIDMVDVDNVGQLIATHCIGALRCAKVCAPFLRESPSSWIVNISSRLGSLQRNALGEFQQEAHSYAYRIAKAALNMATLCLAQDDALFGVRVVAVHPGRMRTPLGGNDAPHSPAESATILLQRLRENSFQSGKFYDLYGSEIPW